MYYRLTTPQKNIWNVQKYYENTAIANQCGAIFYNCEKDISLLLKALKNVIKKQAVFSLKFYEADFPYQVMNSDYRGDIPYTEFFSKQEFDEFAQRFAQEPIELVNGKMYKIRVFKVNEKTGILICMNHLICDAWSFSLLAELVDKEYLNLKEHKECEKEDYSYFDWIKQENIYLESEKYRRDKKYWENEYEIKPEKSEIHYRKHVNESIESGRVSRKLENQINSRIEEFCKKNNVTPAVFFEGILVTYLYKINDENTNITIGIPVLNRNTKLEKQTIGMFVSTIPLTIDVGEKLSFLELLKKIQTKHMSIFRHQKYPYSEILKYIREKHNLVGNLYETMISYQNSKTHTDATTEWYSNGYSEVPFTIHIDNRDDTSTHRITVDYQKNIFENELEVNLILDRFMSIIEQVSERNDIYLTHINILTYKEKEYIINDFNDTYVEYSKDKCVHELFELQAKKTPDKTALIFEDKRFTYKEIDEMSNSLAYELRNHGIGRNDIVPIISKRSWHIIVAMLGILKAGGAYMPIDPSYPEDRIRFMIEDAKCEICLCYQCDNKLDIHTVLLSKFDYAKNTSKIENINQIEDLCYTVFTSGSTGKPKGVLVPHRSVINYCDDNNNNVFHSLIHEEYNKIVSITNFVFDIFVTESLLPLINGLIIIMASESQTYNQNDLSKLITENGVEVLQTTPTRLRSLISDTSKCSYLKTLKSIILGGEAFPRDLYVQLRKYTNADIFNIYGPSETTVWSTNIKVNSCDITIGKPIANTQIYILGKNNELLPIGVHGELCIAGEGVGKGYLNRPDITKERFTRNPFVRENSRHGEILYHTGDLASWRTDGEIEYLGRIDTQVKIRGLRVELGEIESVMTQFKGITLSAVTDKKDENNRQYLVGYYTSVEDIDDKELRTFIGSKLPKYMVPNYFMRLDNIPTTPSGKTDRKNLPIPDFDSEIKDYIAPKTETEKKLANIFKDLLNIDNVGENDDFFELGGDSLLAISMISKISEVFLCEITIKDIMDNSSLEKLAQLIDERPTTIVENRKETNEYILLPQQKALYIEWQKNKKSLSYNMPAEVDLPVHTDIEKLKRAIETVWNKYKILKTHILQKDDEIYGVYDKDAKLEIKEYTGETVRSFVQPFNLEQDVLIRIGFFENKILFDMHHIIADGTSLGLLIHNILSVYNGNQCENEMADYFNYSNDYYRRDFTEYKRFFKEHLKCDFEKVELPVADKKSDMNSKEYIMTDNDIEIVKRYKEKYNLTDTMFYLGIYGILLSKYTAKDDVLSSVVLQNRNHLKYRNTLGMFVNTLPVYFNTNKSVDDYFTSIRKYILGLYEYQELSFFEIANAVGMNDKNIINTSFVLQTDELSSLVIEGERLKPKYENVNVSKFDLLLEVSPHKESVTIRFEMNSEKYDEILMDQLFSGWNNIIRQLDCKNLSDICVLGDKEIDYVVNQINQTRIEYDSQKTIIDLFEQQVNQNRDKTALIYQGKEISYGELDALSNSLAMMLRENGVSKGDKVAVYLNRDERVIIAQLAVLRLGAVFIPIDTRYPKDRIEYILQTSNAKVILQNKENETKFENEVMIENWKFLKDNIVDISERVNVEDTCYIIFTSGSTGRPKGCTLSNKGLVNFCINNNILPECRKLVHPVAISVNTISFDFFIAESLLPLLNGFTVVLASEDESTKQDLFANLVNKYNGNIVQTTPTRYKIYFNEEGKLEFAKKIKVIVTSGETLTKELLNKFTMYSDAKIFNPIGPSECSVWDIGGELNQTDRTNMQITIGKPIANTQAYILDMHGQLVPQGVAGELCIAGAGVGNGYLNNPELTKRTFVTNPFATDENQHGKIMYHTGDLVRLNRDGDIEYLGRIDSQVKIRGLRIELGEVESVMNSYKGITEAVAGVKEDKNKKQFLVGYYICEHEIDHAKFRAYLLSKLPKYMVPNYFMQLDKMPVTPSGKTDRKSLPLPDISVERTNIVKPSNEFERVLCKILKQILHIDEIGIEDDFFELGGDSLYAIEYVAKAHTSGIDFNLQNVFDYPTIAQLEKFLHDGIENKTVYQKSDFEKYQYIFEKNQIENDFIPVRRNLGNVFLTGATGFLGSHVLGELLEKETGHIYCLVRGENQIKATERLYNIIKYYYDERYLSILDERITVVCGDITQKESFIHTTDEIHTVIHTAASVKHYGSYQYFNNMNVNGTKNVVDFAKSKNARMIHISTLSVSGNSLADDFSVYRSAEEKMFYESSFYIGQPLDNVYVRSKFEAEKVVYDAMLDGLDTKVIRVGNLTNRESDYKFQPNYKNNAFLTRVKAILEFGMFPDYLMYLYAEFSPIDKTAEGVIKIAQYADKQNIFHLNSNKPIYFDQFLKVVQSLNISMKIVDGNTFIKSLEDTMRQSGREYIFEAVQNDMDKAGKLVYDSNIRIMNDFTLWFLKKVGFEWNQTDETYIDGYINYFRELGYFEV